MRGNLVRENGVCVRPGLAPQIPQQTKTRLAPWKPQGCSPVLAKLLPYDSDVQENALRRVHAFGLDSSHTDFDRSVNIQLVVIEKQNF